MTGPAGGTAGRWRWPASDLQAGADALIGLAADALGVGRFAASAAALRRAGELLAGSAAPPRLPVRLAWVTAELAMACGDGATAVGHAERGVELAATAGSARHGVKSDVILAAALCSAGEIEASRRVADAALQDAERLGIDPAALGVGLPAGRHRQRDTFAGTGGGDPRRVGGYSPSLGRRVVGPVTRSAPSGSLLFS